MTASTPIRINHFTPPPPHDDDDENSHDDIHPIAHEIRTPLAVPLPPPSPLVKAFSQTSLNLKFSLKEWKNQKKEQVKNNFKLETWKNRLKAFMKLVKSRRFWESLLICYGFIPLGVGLAMLGPTLPSLQQKLGTDEGTMGLVSSILVVVFVNL